MSKTRKYILAILVTVAVTFLGGFLMELFPTVGMWIIMGGTLVLMGLFIALVVHLMKKLVSYAVRNARYRRTAHEDYSWGQVAAAMAILPPLGLFYVIHKTGREKEIFFLNGVKLTVIGGTLVLLTLPPILLVFVTGTDDPSGLWFLLFFPGAYTLLGAVLILLGIRVICRGRVNDRLLHLTLEEKITRMDRLCAHTGMTYPKVTARIQWLIDNELLRGAYIYHKDKEIIIPRISPRIAIKCRTCAGTTVLYANDERECVYCGGRI